MLLMVVTSISSAAGSTKTVKFAAGETVIDSDQGSDHVVVKDTQGEVISESWCDSGTFDAYLALFTRLKESVARGDRNAVVKLVVYPFRVNAKKPLVFRNETSLLKGYDKVFTPQVLDKIRKAEPAAVFCRNGEGMLGDGVVWAMVSTGAAKVAVVNQ